MAGKTIANWTQ